MKFSIQFPLHCFLIDDDVDDQEIFYLALKEVNAAVNCSCANDAIQALEKLRNDLTFTPQCIFLDMNMPRIDGKQCLQSIKEIQRLKDVPVFMYSTYADAKIIGEAKQMGASDFIIKPASIPLLVQVLTELFTQHFAQV